LSGNNIFESNVELCHGICYCSVIPDVNIYLETDYLEKCVNRAVVNS